MALCFVTATQQREFVVMGESAIDDLLISGSALYLQKEASFFGEKNKWILDLVFISGIDKKFYA